MNDLITRVKSICDELARQDGTGGQIALAIAAEASKSVVNQWLAGKIKSMDISYALNIEHNLGYNHIWLMIGKGDRRVSRSLGSDEGAEIKAPASKVTLVDEAHMHERLPKTPNPVQADVLAAIGFVTEQEARVLNLMRVATERGRKLIMSAANGAPKLTPAAVVDDKAHSG